MGPVLLGRNIANLLAWAHYRCRNILLMVTNGPIVSRKKCCQYACMGPLSLMNNAANGHEWAQCSYQQMLPIPLDTPIIAAEKCCQCLRMGPVFLGRIVANTFGWAHYCCRKILPMATAVEPEAQASTPVNVWGVSGRFGRVQLPL